MASASWANLVVRSTPQRGDEADARAVLVRDHSPAVVLALVYLPLAVKRLAHERGVHRDVGWERHVSGILPGPGGAWGGGALPQTSPPLGGVMGYASDHPVLSNSSLSWEIGGGAMSGASRQSRSPTS